MRMPCLVQPSTYLVRLSRGGVVGYVDPFRGGWGLGVLGLCGGGCV